MDREGNLPSDSIRDLIFGDLSESEVDYDSFSIDESQPATIDNVIRLDSDHDSDIDYISEDEQTSDTDDASDVMFPRAVWREWTANDVDFPEFKYTLEDRSGFIPLPGFDRGSELHYFQLFFTDELFLQIINETNRYAQEKIKANTPLTKNSTWHSWIDLTLPEFKAFLGVIMNMSLNPKPEMEDYFSSDWLDYQTFFKDIIFSKERFFQIFWTLHLSPPNNIGPVLGTVTRSGKVKRVVQYLEKKFREYYCPSDTVSIGESTIDFKGRVAFKVYNKDKPNKWGIKVFVVSDAVNGYVCAMEPYMGSITTSNLDRPELLATSRIVLSLIQKLQQTYGSVEGLKVFTDRYYTSVELAKELYLKKIHLTGTVNRNRKGLPREIRIKPKLKRGEMLSLRKDNDNDDPSFIHVLEWKDKRPVTVLTTLYDNKTEIVKRIVKGGVEESIIKPSIICRYNEYMGGVDISDHYIASYAFTRRSIKWWRKVFFWLLEVAIVNSFILCNTNRPPGMKDMRQRKFRKKLILALVGDVRNTKKRGRPSVTEEDVRLNGKLHIPQMLDARKGKDCAVCSDRSALGERKRTRMYCDTCLNKPGLHAGQCFQRYHTLKKFKNQ
ncbi:hypothetical protein LSTR_LSTR000098 [Laodelphax striatellus]|uniref:PiggyBac transposable element-derived protein domain-containing protein n=1 Tax=Laodelphax striatellus TaxID=195883 RepID=A0A482X6I1_LAOST|nr:hypothetical protein LSTR_LSTR000098 [Laodelphax striatellus]